MELVSHFFALNLLEFKTCVLVDELFDRKVATTNANVDVVVLNADAHRLGAELVNAFTCASEQLPEAQGAGVVIDEISKVLVDVVALDYLVHLSGRLVQRCGATNMCTVGLDGRLHVDDLVSVRLVLNLDNLHLLEQF